jgi:hypothetical protein
MKIKEMRLIVLNICPESVKYLFIYYELIMKYPTEQNLFSIGLEAFLPYCLDIFSFDPGQ